MSAPGVLRTGSVDDLDTVVGLMDGAVAWPASQGRAGQWGDQPWSASAARMERLRGMIEGGELLVLDRDDRAVAAQLVRFYESAGFAPTVPFEVKGWPGQVLERRG